MDAMQITKAHIEVTVPAGTYFLGDPCYAVPNDDWMDLLESCNYFQADREGGSPIGEVKGFQVLSFGTKYGDGQYYDEDGRRFPVDAGMIGLTPEGLIEGEPYGGVMVTFDSPVRCFEEDGTLTFGPIVIHTGDDADDWDDDWDDDDE